ncbi:MAG: PilZ domain-containing protein [Candidatus Omnitrophica bacterium]|nr:PilZ domain-containing protein [Candidatus Omnitrophota bacterium]
MEAHSELNISEICGVIWKRKVILLILFSIVFFSVLQVSLLMPPIYRASAKVMLSAPDIFFPSGSTLMEPKIMGTAFLYTQREIMESSFILNEALEDARKKGVARDMDFATLKSKLHVEYVGNSSIIAANVDHQNPKEAVILANAISAAFINYHLNEKKELVEQNLDIISNKMSVLKKEIADLETKLKEFRDKDQSVFYQSQVHDYLYSLLTLERQNISSVAGIKRMQGGLEKIKKAIKTGDIKSFYPLQISTEDPTVLLAEDPWLQELKREVVAAHSHLGELLAEYTEEYSGVQGSRNYVAALEKDLGGEILDILQTYKDYYESYIEFLEFKIKTNNLEIDKYKEEIENISREIKKSASKQIEFDAFLKDYNMKQDIYAAFLQRQKDLELLEEEISATGLPNIKMFEPAILPLERISPDLPLNLFIGALCGILIGVAGSLALKKRKGPLKKKDKISPQLQGLERPCISRSNILLPVTYELIGDAGHIKYKAVTKDISGNGVRLKTDKSLSKGTQFLLRIELKGNDKDSIEAIGEVVWVSTSEEKNMFECGLQFVKIEPQEREKLINYLYGEHYLPQSD